MARKKRAPGEPITIKKYANRRLYNTETSSYVTLDHLATMIKNGHDFIVLDAKNSDDLTRTVLTQIIFEKETKNENILPLNFLRQLIRFYGDHMQDIVPAYLQGTMDVLNQHREQISQSFQGDNHESFIPLFEEMTRQNMAFFDQTMQTLARSGKVSANKPCTTSKPEQNKQDQDTQEISDLKKQLATLKEKVDSLSS